MKADSLTSFKNGAFSGLISVVLMQPFNVIRTNMIIYSKSYQKLGIVESIKSVIKSEGRKGFYRGFIPAILKSTIGGGTYFHILEFTKQLKFFQNNILNNSFSSGVARTIQTIIINPFLLLRTREEVMGSHYYRNIFQSIKTIHIEEGFSGFFKGLKANLIKDVPFSCIFYSIYEYTKLTLKSLGLKHPSLIIALASLNATLIQTSLTNPLDVIRTRVQYAHLSRNKRDNYKGLLKAVCDIYKHEGIKGLGNGLLLRLIRKGFMTIVIWCSYEKLKLKD